MNNRYIHIKSFLFIALALVISHSVQAQTVDTSRTTPHVPTADSIATIPHMSPLVMPLSKNAITDIIHYTATDSISINLKSRQASLYHEGNIKYQQMELRADRVDVDFDHQTLHALGVRDSAQRYIGRPFFKQGDAEYNADTITFNYNSQRGIIHGVITQEGDGFLHGNKVKKINDSVMYLNGGQYTTCNYAHPHFALNFTKSKLIMGDKIITGPAYLSISDVPTPLALPFAFFPLSKGVSSGLLMPSYGWMDGRGYYLKDGGWYFSMGDHYDLALTGEVYTNLSWTAEAKSNYYRRYKHKGYFDVRYGRTHEGIRGDSNTYNSFTDFKIAWKHDQDPKANPHSRFSADVNLQSRNYNRNTTSTSDFFNSTTTSSVSYTTTFGNVFNLAASARESYNVRTGMMNVQLPTLSLSTNTLYPFRRKTPSGAYRWYENISLTYSLDGQNNVNALDSNILKRSTLNQMQYGIQHRIPIQSSIKVLRFFNWTNSITYNERWHWSTIRKDVDSLGILHLDTIRGFRANRDFAYTSSLTTRIYGMFNFKYGPVRALRHVINPSLSFNFTPDFGSQKLGYWQQYTDSTGYVHRYSIFEQSLYGGPSDGRSGRIALSVGNSVEMKVRKRQKNIAETDSSNEELTKVTLIESLNFAINYDLAKDSLNLSDLAITGHTTLLKNLVLNYSGSFTPYVVDTLGNKHNHFLWDPAIPSMPHTSNFLQRTNATWSAQISYSLNNKTFNKNSSKTNAGFNLPALQSPYNDNPLALMGTYADFSLPWNLSLNYTFSHVSSYVAAKYNFKSEIVQNISLSGNLNLTDKWRFAFTTGYDFANHGMSYTSIDIFRDLHCWEMRFNWIPFGYYKSWNFQINIKAESLKDVKWQKRHPYQSNQGYYSY